MRSRAPRLKSQPSGNDRPGHARHRDIVMRLPDADEARIRKELSGNLCRCTGYMGIVSAIKRVLAARRT